MRNSYTTKQKKAKCLAYRDGKRCDRVAKIEGTYTITTTRMMEMHQSLCKECAQRLGAEVIQESDKGFSVHTTLFGPIARMYEAIQ